MLALLALRCLPARVHAQHKSADTIGEWTERMEARFRANPHLMSTKGSGWKPFNRIKWLHEGRYLRSNGEAAVTLRSRVAQRAARMRRAGRVEQDPAIF